MSFLGDIFGGLFGGGGGGGGVTSGGIGNKDLQTTNQSTSEHNYTDQSLGAGDNSIVSQGGVSINIADSSGSGDAMYLASQALGVAVNGQTLQAILQHGTSATLDRAIESNNASVAAAIAAAEKAARDASASASAAAADAISAANRSATTAANAASDAIAANNRATANAIGFADTALASVNTANRSAFGFADSALTASLQSSNRAVTSAENALDSSLAFARQTDTSTKNLLDDVLSGVFGLVRTTSERAADEAQATREFAGQFVGDFYESQKSGDVQTLQMLTKTAGAVLAVIAVAWAIRGKV